MPWTPRAGGIAFCADIQLDTPLDDVTLLPDLRDLRCYAVGAAVGFRLLTLPAQYRPIPVAVLLAEVHEAVTQGLPLYQKHQRRLSTAPVRTAQFPLGSQWFGSATGACLALPRRELLEAHNTALNLRRIRAGLVGNVGPCGVQPDHIPDLDQFDVEATASCWEDVRPAMFQSIRQSNGFDSLAAFSLMLHTAARELWDLDNALRMERTGRAAVPDLASAAEQPQASPQRSTQDAAPVEQPQADAHDETLSVENCLPRPGRVAWKGHEVPLQPLHWRLLKFLLERSRWPVGFGEVEDAVWGNDRIRTKTIQNAVSVLNNTMEGIKFPITYRTKESAILKEPTG